MLGLTLENNSGDTYKDVVEKGKTSATENHLSITHVDLSNLGGNREENVAKACRRADKVCKVMHGHTSVQGLFLVLLAGSKNLRAAAGVTVVRPLALHSSK